MGNYRGGTQFDFILCGFTGTSSLENHWNMITFRIGMHMHLFGSLAHIVLLLCWCPAHTVLAIYTRTPAAHDALRDFGIVQLPSVSTLKSFTLFNLEKSRYSEEHLTHAQQLYIKMIEEKKANHEKVPFHEGILIFDEVKVGLKIHYHAKTGQFIGLAMSADELGSLHDVYQTLQLDHRTQKAGYTLQFLWRCTASDFDVLGPYFTSAAGLKSKFLIATLFDAMYCLQLHGFETKALVCDGASPNLAAIKLLTGFGSGTFGSKPAGSCGVVHEVKAWFINPFTKEKVFTLICPLTRSGI